MASTRNDAPDAVPARLRAVLPALQVVAQGHSTADVAVALRYTIPAVLRDHQAALTLLNVATVHAAIAAARAGGLLD